MIHDRGSKVTILLSGGLDSTALVDYYLRLNAKVSGLHIQYNQRNAMGERSAVERVSQHYQIQTKVVELGFSLNERGVEYLCRNGLFLLIAASISQGGGILSCGIHANSDYYDATKRFIIDMQTIIDGYFLGTKVLDVPFIDFTKSQIVEYSRRNDVPIDMTYSCEQRGDSPCEICSSCVERSRALNE